MQANWQIFRAVLDCSYKAWLLERESSPDSSAKEFSILGEDGQLIPDMGTLTDEDRIAITAASFKQITATNQLTSSVFQGSKYIKRAEALYTEAKAVIENAEPPVFYKNPHCPQCKFKESCYAKLRERDCLSLVGEMTPKIIAKYHKKGIFSITQLSHVFRPRRRGVKTSISWQFFVGTKSS